MDNYNLEKYFKITRHHSIIIRLQTLVVLNLNKKYNNKIFQFWIQRRKCLVRNSLLDNSFLSNSLLSNSLLSNSYEIKKLLRKKVEFNKRFHKKFQ